MKKILKTIIFTSFVSLLVVLVAATIIEKIYTTEFVHQVIYGTWWFVFLWMIFGAASVIYIFQQKLYKKKAAFCMHCAFALILIGALVTFISAERGYIHIRQGETTKTYVSEKDMNEYQLPFDVKLVLFDIEYHPETDQPADFISFLKVDTTICKVSMNNIYKYEGYRFYQLDYDEDEMGTTLLMSHDPLGIGITYSGYALLAFSMVWLLFLRIGWKGTLVVFGSIALLWVYISQLNPMTPVLRTPMLGAHVSFIMGAYGLVVFITITSIIALCKPSKREKMYRLNFKLLYPTIFLLAMGIFIGAVWANISWGRYWGWDAKETWALITLLVYALPFHRSTLPYFNNPKRFHIYCLIAFLSVLMTFFGVTFLLGGIHSYV